MDKAGATGSYHIIKKSWNNMKTAVAVFVKTPGLSPIKTRLAKSIGQKTAEIFFIQCVKTIEKTLLDVHKITDGQIQPFWAVGEKDGLSNNLWKNFISIHTGEGSLGERQYHIYSTLLDKYDSVILLGADSPQITSSQILEAVKIINTTKQFVMGPALDGGYYLLGGTAKIPKQIWSSVQFSVYDTSEKLVAALNPICSTKYLYQMVDADTIEDLNILKDELSQTGFIHHNELVSWMDNNIWKTQIWESQLRGKVCV